MDVIHFIKVHLLPVVHGMCFLGWDFSTSWGSGSQTFVYQTEAPDRHWNRKEQWRSGSVEITTPPALLEGVISNSKLLFEIKRILH